MATGRKTAKGKTGEGDEGAGASEAETAWIPLGSLVLWAQNPRVIGERAVRKIADSIRRFGWGAPVLAKPGDRTVIAGHARPRSARSLAGRWARMSKPERENALRWSKMSSDEREAARESIPERDRWHAEAIHVATEREVLVRWRDLDSDDAIAFAIADNRTSEEAKWQTAELGEVLAELERAGAELEATAPEAVHRSDLDRPCAGLLAATDHRVRVGQRLDHLEPVPGRAAENASVPFVSHDESPSLILSRSGVAAPSLYESQ